MGGGEKQSHHVGMSGCSTGLMGMERRIGDDVFSTFFSLPSASRRTTDVICVPVLFSPPSSTPVSAARTSVSNVVKEDCTSPPPSLEL